MTPRQRQLPAFDSHASDYEQQCMQGLKVSGESKQFFAEGRVAFLRSWWDREGRCEPQRIVDYGCGIGDVTAILAEVFPEAQITGLDPSARCVERAAQRYATRRVGFSVLQGFDADAEEPADLIHLNGVVHHVDPEDRPRLFDALAQRVSRHGVVALFENNPLNPGTRIVMARIPFDRDAAPVPAWEAHRRLRSARLRPLYTGYMFYFPRFLRVLRPLERLLVRLPLGAQYCVLSTPDER